MLPIILLAACLVVPLHAYSNGAPSQVCHNGLVPEHHIPGQESEPPYRFNGANGVRSGGNLKLTLDGHNFLGFAIQAHDANNHPVGQFKVIENAKSQTIDCHGQGDTLTHRKINRDNPLTRLEFEWIPPRNFVGKVTIKGTVAENGGKFWVAKVLKTVDVQK